MNTSKCKTKLTACLLAVMTVGSISPVQAEMIGTEQMLTQEMQRDAQDRVNAFLAGTEVKQKLTAWGVDPATVDARIAALSPAELARLSHTIDNRPAGGDLGIIGVLFVVLIILELTGVINIFNNA